MGALLHYFKAVVLSFQILRTESFQGNGKHPLFVLQCLPRPLETLCSLLKGDSQPLQPSGSALSGAVSFKAAKHLEDWMLILEITRYKQQLNCLDILLYSARQGLKCPVWPEVHCLL